MPNIPDIKPEINITLKDATNLLLTSIAEEELSIARLMDAEKSKILHVLNKFKNNESKTEELLSVNNSVNQTIINLIKMQMLLQFKLEDVKKLIQEVKPKPCPPQKPCCPPDNNCPPDCSQNDECRNFWCMLIGKSKGTVSNPSDEFYCCKAALCAFVSSRSCKDNIITYQVDSNCGSLCLTACGSNIKFEYPCEINPDKVKLCGKASLTIISKCRKTVINVNFGLLVCLDDETGKTGFQMVIEDENQAVIHNSGFVESCSCGKGLKLCCYEQ